MIAVDTNIVVRLFTGDDPEQYQKAYALFQQETVFLPDTVILETAWVLRHSYAFGQSAIVEAFRRLLGLPNVCVTDPDLTAQALSWIEQGMDFADALHLAQSQSADALYTFDKGFSKRGRGIGNCPVLELS
jgi:predicted nucleic-acid-binding protein